MRQMSPNGDQLGSPLTAQATINALPLSIHSERIYLQAA